MIKKSFLQILFFFLAGIISVYGQQNNYQLANQLMQQQKYEEALPILQNLHEDNPDAFVFFDRYIDCLINLTDYEKAEQVARENLNSQRNIDETALKLAEILHLKGDKSEAELQWQQVLDRNRNNIQMFYKTASSMMNRNEYELAINVYRTAQDQFDNSTLFLNELANTYMQAGQFENAVREYFRLIISNPDQVSLVQQRLLRMRDDNLYQIAAFELEDRLMEIDHTHRAYPDLYQLLTWLLLETEEYRRAHTLARQYENSTSHTVYSLFSLGNQLLSSGEYELAADAYEFYLDSGSQSVRFRAMEELANTHIQQVQYLKQNNLETSDVYQNLYEKAYNYSEIIINEWPEYERADRIYTKLIDISLDQFKDSEKAERWYEHMIHNLNNSDDAFAFYAEGRLALFNENFTTARQRLTRADRSTSESDLSEKSRYYLSLSDFYAGDFEFAAIQLRSLERRHSSFYANNAIKLGMWIKNGQRADTTGSILSTIGQSLHLLHTGKYDRAIEKLEPILASPQHPFSDDLTVELSTQLTDKYGYFLLRLLEHQISGHSQSPLRERMFWDRIQLIEKVVSGSVDFSEDTVHSYDFLPEFSAFDYTQQNLQDHLEDLLMEFPNGFYASFAREKLQNIQITTQSL